MPPTHHLDYVYLDYVHLDYVLDHVSLSDYETRPAKIRVNVILDRNVSVDENLEWFP